jgi:hypothetical protein
LRFEHRQEVSGTNGFNFAKRKNLHAAKNFTCDSLPETCPVRDARCSMTQLSDADCGGYDIVRAATSFSR